MNKILVDTKIYPLEIIKSTAYKFIDSTYIQLKSAEGDAIEVSLKSKMDKNNQNNIGGEFYNELLNNVLRIKIAERNKDIRKLIVQQALYAAVSNKPYDAGDNNASYQDDPLGIAVPWEEKYGEEN